MPGESVSTLNAARFVLVNGLSISTRQRSQMGQGSAWRCQASGHTHATRTSATTASETMMARLIDHFEQYGQ